MASLTIADGTPLREQMERVRDFLNAAHPGTGSLYGFVLEHGREYRSTRWTTWRGSGFRRGRVRECFKNAEQLAVRFDASPALTYVEGFATKGAGYFPIHHAWCADQLGRVVDRTWRADADVPVENWEYLGVPFATDFVEEWTMRRGAYGLLGEGPLSGLLAGIAS